MHIPSSITTHSTESKLREWSSLIGIITAIVGNVLISFALNIQRYAHIRLSRQRTSDWNTDGYGTQQSEIAEERAQLNLHAPAQNGSDDDETAPLNQAFRSRASSASTIKQSEKPLPDAERKNYLRSPYWWAGILLMTIGEAGNFLAYGFAPASIVSPLGVVALVSNCVIAPFMLKERFRRRDLLGVIVAVGGAVTVVLSAKTSETKMGPHDIWEAITRWEFELYLGITGALIIALMWASGRYGEKSVLIDLGLVGLFGGYTALSTKGVASLLSDTLWRALTFPITYLLVAILVATALLQIRYINKALQRFDSTQVIPTQFVLFTISVIVGSAVLYRDFESATAERVGKFIGGCALTFLGVYLITSGRAPDGLEEAEDDDCDAERAIGLVDEERYQDDLGAENGESSQARRKSHTSIRFDDGDEVSVSAHRKDSPDAPKPALSENSRAPPVKVTSSDESDDSSVRSPPGTTSPLLDNPWLTSRERLAPPRQPLQTTNSSPLLPSEAQNTVRPATPRFQTALLPSPPKTDRPSTLSRRSMSRIMPGPLASPLSSSLSAIVADSLRRGVETSPTRRRPPLSGLRKSKSQRTAGETASGEEPQGSSN